MDRASQILAQGVPPGVPYSYRALADHGDISHSTLHHRARGRRSIEEKASQGSWSKLGKGSRETPSNTASEESQGVRLGATREEYIWKDCTLIRGNRRSITGSRGLGREYI